MFPGYEHNDSLKRVSPQRGQDITRPAAATRAFSGAHSPPCEGGVALPLRKCREASEAAETGWSLTRHVSKRVFKRFGVSEHPGASRHPSFARRGFAQRKRLPGCRKNGEAGDSPPCI